ncbi:MAG: hypothetical protein NZZ41_02155 [Candidatus Dojkabacteria bacterium]|nr:hypothetical protein [Candidatus Dojkabacteria bacterium]
MKSIEHLISEDVKITRVRNIYIMVCTSAREVTDKEKYKKELEEVLPLKDNSKILEINKKYITVSTKKYAGEVFFFVDDEKYKNFLTELKDIGYSLPEGWDKVSLKQNQEEMQ